MVKDEGWELLMSGKPREAIAEFRAMYSAHGSRGFLHNIAIAYLCLDEVAAAANEYKRLIAEKAHFTTGEYSGLGLCHWLSADPANAVSVWRDGLNCEMADGAGGVELPALLFFASVRAPEFIGSAEARRLLRKRLRDPRSQYWPGPIAKYLLGQFTEQQFRDGALHKTEEIHVRRKHKAEFYIAVRAEEEGNHGFYVAQMLKCAQASGCQLNDELYLARYEARLTLGTQS